MNTSEIPYLTGTTPEEAATQRILAFSEASLARHPNGYVLAYSGGKDSDVLLHLTRASGVPFDAVYNMTYLDAPETIRHIRRVPDICVQHPSASFLDLVRKNGPPTRMLRWCCRELKEQASPPAIVLTGIRWQESRRRARRRMFEICRRRKSVAYLHPLIDWTTQDIWNYIARHHIAVNRLYSMGYHRVGCIGCPMLAVDPREAAQWPGLFRLWRKALDGWWAATPRAALTWHTPDALWHWWTDLRNTHREPIDATPSLYCPQQDE